MPRIARWNPANGGGEGWHYSARVLGGWSATLAALSGFFTRVWEKPVDELTGQRSEFVLQQAGWLLRSAGRFQEASDALLAAVESATRNGHLRIAGVSSRNLNQLHEVIGEIEAALTFGLNAVAFASEGTKDRAKNLTRLAGTLNILGRLKEAQSRFEEAGLKSGPNCACDSVETGYEYCLYANLLIDQGRTVDAKKAASDALGIANRIKAAPIITGFAHLIIGRAIQFDVDRGKMEKAKIALNHFNLCVDLLRENGEIHQIPRGLLARAEFCLSMLSARQDGLSLAFRAKSLETCIRDLKQALELSERTGMNLWAAKGRLLSGRLHALRGDLKNAKDDFRKAQRIADTRSMQLVRADICLQLARLFYDREALSTATTLIRECGYRLREQELQRIKML